MGRRLPAKAPHIMQARVAAHPLTVLLANTGISSSTRSEPERGGFTVVCLQLEDDISKKRDKPNLRHRHDLNVVVHLPDGNLLL